MVVGDPHGKVRFVVRGGDRISPFTTNNLTVTVGCGECGEEARWVRVAMLDPIALSDSGGFRAREGALQSIARARGRVLGDGARGRYRYVKRSELFGRIDSGWVRWRAERSEPRQRRR